MPTRPRRRPGSTREGSALGSYWDPDRAELVVVVGPDSDIGEAEAEKLVGGPFRLERLEIAKKTADSIREEIAGREFAPGGAEVQLREPPGPADRPRRPADGCPRVGDRAAGQGAPGDRAARRQAGRATCSTVATTSRPSGAAPRSRAAAGRARPGSRSASRRAPASSPPRPTATRSARPSAPPPARSSAPSPSAARWARGGSSTTATWSSSAGSPTPRASTPAASSALLEGRRRRRRSGRRLHGLLLERPDQR